MTDLLALTAQLVDIPSESFDERAIADHLEAELERTHTDAEAARQETEETVRRAEEASHLREATTDAGRP